MADITKQDLQHLLDQSFQKFKEEVHQDMVHTFNQGLQEMVIPEFDRLENKMEKGFNGINTQLDNLARKTDKILGKQLDDEYKLENQGKRITKLEAKQVSI